MIIGVPEEMRNNENKVGMTPAGTHELVKKGDKILIENYAGAASRLRNTDDDKASEKLV